MYDLNQSRDVIAQMRDGEMSDQQIIGVCKAVISDLLDKCIYCGFEGSVEEVFGHSCSA